MISRKQLAEALRVLHIASSHPLTDLEYLIIQAQEIMEQAIETLKDRKKDN